MRDFEVWMDIEGNLFTIDYDECFELREAMKENDEWECLGLL